MLKMEEGSAISEQQSYLVLAICTIGFLSLSKTLLKLLQWVWSTFLRPPRKLTRYGSWALVTGCTDGIGKALTFDLASKGLNLVLVGRNPQKLKSTSDEIWDKFGKKKTQIKTIVIDFEKSSGEEIEASVKKGIEGLDVGVLVNNVGLSTNGARFFHEVDWEGMNSLINVNIGSVNWVTKAVLPGMLIRKRGAIINIGSGSAAALPSYPLFTIYAATKAYLGMLSRCLSVEYKQYGIDIQCQIPMLVATKMASIKKTTFFVPSPKQFSKASIRWMGYDIVCVPYWTHAVECFLMSLMPVSLLNSLILRKFLNLRKKVLHKEAMKSSSP